MAGDAVAAAGGAVRGTGRAVRGVGGASGVAGLAGDAIGVDDGAARGIRDDAASDCATDAGGSRAGRGLPVSPTLRPQVQAPLADVWQSHTPAELPGLATCSAGPGPRQAVSAANTANTNGAERSASAHFVLYILSSHRCAARTLPLCRLAVKNRVSFRLWISPRIRASTTSHTSHKLPQIALCSAAIGST